MNAFYDHQRIAFEIDSSVADALAIPPDRKEMETPLEELVMADN